MELSGKKIAVIGGAGFVGSHIIDQLLAEPVEQIVIYDNFVRGTRANLAQVRITLASKSLMPQPPTTTAYGANSKVSMAYSCWQRSGWANAWTILARQSTLTSLAPTM